MYLLLFKLLHDVRSTEFYNYDNGTFTLSNEFYNEIRSNAAARKSDRKNIFQTSITTIRRHLIRFCNLSTFAKFANVN